MRKSIWLWLGLLVIASMMLAACATGSDAPADDVAPSDDAADTSDAADTVDDSADTSDDAIVQHHPCDPSVRSL